MSQVYKQLTSAGPIPPNIATQYITDVNSPAVPAFNELIVTGIDSEPTSGLPVIDIDGIRTDGSSGSNTLSIILTNRVTGLLSTIDDTVVTLIPYTLPTTGVYNFNVSICAYNLSSSIGATFNIYAGVIFVGGIATVLNTPDIISNPQAGMTATAVSVTTDGAATVLFQIKGLPATTNINWYGLANFDFAGV